MVESETRIQQALAAYEAASKGKRELGPSGKEYWSMMIENLEKYNLPIPNIENLAFLDLGGGSDQVRLYDDGDKGWSPWLARYLASLGAPWVVNVDTGPQNPIYQDVYTHVQLSLSNREDFSLTSELEKRGLLRPYDIVFSSMLVDEYNPSPSLERFGINHHRLKSRIQSWAKELLKPEGYLFFESGDEGYLLQDGELVNFCKPAWYSYIHK